MSHTIKNAKAVQSKSRTHTVKELGGDVYEVTSGETGKVYHVHAAGNGGSCTCDWAKYRPASGGGKSGCSHVIAVVNHIAGSDDRRVMAWATLEDANRQHRPVMDIGDGVVLTTRKAGA